MRRLLLLMSLFAILACRRPSADVDAVVDGGGAQSSTPVSSSSSSAASSPTRPQAPRARVDPKSIVEQWNAAHVARDARMLEPLYADTVDYYGKKLPKEECVKGKTSAFAAAPDFTQSLGAIDVEQGKNVPEDAWVRFIKTVTTKGKSNDYPALLILRDGKIRSEQDDTSWCLDSAFFPNDRLIPPFTMSASEAAIAVEESKYLANLRRKSSAAHSDEKDFSCARRCTPPSRECGFHIRISDYASTASSNVLAYLYVDPTTRLLWFQEFGADGGDVWRSEAIPKRADAGPR